MERRSWSSFIQCSIFIIPENYVNDSPRFVTRESKGTNRSRGKHTRWRQKPRKEEHRVFLLFLRRCPLPRKADVCAACRHSCRGSATQRRRQAISNGNDCRRTASLTLHFVPRKLPINIYAVLFTPAHPWQLRFARESGCPEKLIGKRRQGAKVAESRRICLLTAVTLCSLGRGFC